MSYMTTASLPHSASIRRVSIKFSLITIFAGLAAFAVQAADARGPGGGGFRRGAGLSRPSHSFGASSGQFRSAADRPNVGNASTGISRRANGNGNTGIAKSGNDSGNSGIVNHGRANSGIANSGNGNSGVVNNGNVGSGNIKTGNVAVGNNVDVNVNGGWYGYPAGTGAAYATGFAVGSSATAVARSSYYYALPVGCSPYVYSSYRYYSCAGTWYQERYQSNTAVYVVVADPMKTK